MFLMYPCLERPLIWSALGTSPCTPVSSRFVPLSGLPPFELLLLLLHCGSRNPIAALMRTAAAKRKSNRCSNRSIGHLLGVVEAQLSRVLQTSGRDLGETKTVRPGKRRIA